MLVIDHVQHGSTADRLRLKPGDTIIAINGHEIHDVVGYRFYISDDRIKITLQNKKGEQRIHALRKEPDDDLGLEFPPIRIIRCRNKCIFCFVDQMPSGCRKSLYIKDDDYRASFLHGNYITLGALSEGDWNRIVSERLSPLYISVHATDPKLRSIVLGNKNAPDILTSMKRLALSGIKMHAQIVLCPGINDGRHLDRTLKDLSELFPSVISVAVVPVGLTKFRTGLSPIKMFAKREANLVVRTVTQFGMRSKKLNGTRLVFASDEFYIKAGLPMPHASYYEDFPQIENGVGMVADFLSNASRVRLPKKVRPIKLTIATGKSFRPILNDALQRLSVFKNVTIQTVAIRNDYFGKSVTVAGLLTGRDIIAGLKRKNLGDLVVVPKDALKEEDDVFLDGLQLNDLEKTLSTPVSSAGHFKDIVNLLHLRKERKL